MCILSASSLSSLQSLWDGIARSPGSTSASSPLGILELFVRYSVHPASTVRLALANVTRVVVEKVRALLYVTERTNFIFILRTRQVMSEHTESFSAQLAADAGPVAAAHATSNPAPRASCTQFLQRVLLGLTAQLSGVATDSRRGETVLLAVEPVLARLLQEHRRRYLHADAAHSLVVSG